LRHPINKNIQMVGGREAGGVEGSGVKKVYKRIDKDRIDMDYPSIKDLMIWFLGINYEQVPF
jgi:hypothetical protein